MPAKKKVVAIDDAAEVCMLIKEILEGTGEFEVTTTSDPMQAENVIRQVMPDIILVDIVMPKRRGVEVIAAIKKDETIKRIPIVVVSGKGEMVFDKKKHIFHWQPNNPAVKDRGTLPEAKSAEALAQAYGVSDYVAKPFTTPILLEVINENIAKAQKKKAAQEDAPPIEP